MQNIFMILQLFGGLALFLYGMDGMSRAIQLGAGKRLRSLLARCTANPVAGLVPFFIAFFIFLSASGSRYSQ